MIKDFCFHNFAINFLLVLTVTYFKPICLRVDFFTKEIIIHCLQWISVYFYNCSILYGAVHPQVKGFIARNVMYLLCHIWQIALEPLNYSPVWQLNATCVNYFGMQFIIQDTLWLQSCNHFSFISSLIFFFFYVDYW